MLVSRSMLLVNFMTSLVQCDLRRIIIAEG